RIKSGHGAGSPHGRGRADIAPGATELDAQIGHAVMERCGLAAVFVIVIEDRLVQNVIMLERNEFPIGRRAEPYALLGARTMPNGLEHHLAADHYFDGFAELPCRRGRERAMAPWPQLAAEARTDEFRNDAHIFLRQAEHLRQDIACVEN